jgi:RNA polymerase sigma factor (sigma-70 family)
MKIAEVDAATLQSALNGQLAAINTLLLAIQPGVFNLAVRMLGNREDASDATQEIMLKVVTHLAGFPAEAAFSTWVFRIARNHLLTAITRSRESPEVSLEAMAERLQAGLDHAASLGDALGLHTSLTPEDKLAARQVALGCTQNMLMTLDRPQRLAYLLDTVFALSSEQGAQVLGISAAAYRKRLSRVRESLDPFVRRTCGLANPDAACRCERQLPAIKAMQAEAEAGAGAGGSTPPVRLVAVHRSEMQHAERHFGAMLRMSDAAALFRAHPDYHAPASMVAAIRGVLRAEGYWASDAGAALQ